ncbi:MAG: GNAT family N-acetyltransferase [Candidatus Wallbacteria bacterium]|nr:GNAT family N-acetyltransferase [Candidatus Wallbacteria bacterium]
MPARNRGRGLGRRLLQAAIEACRRNGARIVEGYPVTPTKDGKNLPAAFTWMGPIKFFQEQGFETVQALSPSRPLVRLRL